MSSIPIRKKARRRPIRTIVSAAAIIGAACLPGCEFFFGSDDPGSVEETTPPIGKGYDVFDEYASPLYVKEAVLDYDALAAAGMISGAAIESSEFKTVSGTSASSYSTSLSTDVGLSISTNKLLFSGSLKAAFSSERISSTETSYQYATVQARIAKKGYRTTVQTPEALKPYLDSAFATAIDDGSVSPETLFSRFGTHVMTGVIMGARLDYNLSATESGSSGSTSISGYVQASFKNTFASTSASYSADSLSSYESAFSQTEISTSVLGGSSEYGMAIHTDGDYEGWIDSIDGNEVFCDYYGSDSLIPIWEFAEDSTRAAALEDYYLNEWAEARGIGVVGQAILDIKVMSDWGTSYETGGLTYHRVYQNVNRGNDGDPLYLYVAFGTDDGSDVKDPITHIALVYGDTESAAKADVNSTYSLVDVDLNKGVHGSYIYLVYRRGALSSYDPVRNIYIYNKTRDSKTYPYGFSDIEGLAYSPGYRMVDGTYDYTDRVNLNEEVSGDDMYLFRGR